MLSSILNSSFVGTSQNSAGILNYKPSSYSLCSSCSPFDAVKGKYNIETDIKLNLPLFVTSNKKTFSLDKEDYIFLITNSVPFKREGEDKDKNCIIDPSYGITEGYIYGGDYNMIIKKVIVTKKFLVDNLTNKGNPISLTQQDAGYLLKKKIPIYNKFSKIVMGKTNLVCMDNTLIVCGHQNIDGTIISLLDDDILYCLNCSIDYTLDSIPRPLMWIAYDYKVVWIGEDYDGYDSDEKNKRPVNGEATGEARSQIIQTLNISLIEALLHPKITKHKKWCRRLQNVTPTITNIRIKQEDGSWKPLVIENDFEIIL